MKLLFIYNPHSGMSKIKNHLSDILEIMVQADYEVTVYPTQAAGDATRITAEKAGDYDLVVCCGGDGTLDETVNGLMSVDKQIPLGYIPAGSTNDFASSLNIPKDMKQAAKTAVTGKDYWCDVGCFGRDHFIYIAAFGMFTDVSYETKQELKNVLGHAAYILEGAKRIGNHSSYWMRVEYDGHVIEDEFIYGMVTNSLSVGGFKGMTGRDVALNDGLFEVMLIKKPNNAVEFNEILAALTNIRPDSDLIYTFKTSRLEISPHCEIPWTLDGEFGGVQTEILISNKPKALAIRVDEEYL